jgi:hypothetical protein
MGREALPAINADASPVDMTSECLLWLQRLPGALKGRREAHLRGAKGEEEDDWSTTADSTGP